MNFKDQLRKFILDNYVFSSDQSLLDDAASFLQSGLIDSTGILELIFFLEETCGIKVTDEEMIPGNLDSINNVLQFVNSKK
jgi:acyl carrier protein